MLTRGWKFILLHLERGETYGLPYFVFHFFLVERAKVSGINSQFWSILSFAKSYHGSWLKVFGFIVYDRTRYAR